MKNDILKITKMGNSYELSREQWDGNKGYISDYPGLLEEIKKYTWTYRKGDHPYLGCSKLKISLHRFVLDFLYGRDRVSQMLERDCIIEHLDNDGLNCRYNNLHIVTSDENKTKAFSIDKKLAKQKIIPNFITDVFYDHDEKYYQLQITFNKDLFKLRERNQIKAKAQYIEAFYCIYNEFTDLFLDWYYILPYQTNGRFDLNKFHANCLMAKKRPDIYLTKEEEQQAFIERDGKIYFPLRTEGESGISVIVKSGYVDLKEKLKE